MSVQANVRLVVRWSTLTEAGCEWVRFKVGVWGWARGAGVRDGWVGVGWGRRGLLRPTHWGIKNVTSSLCGGHAALSHTHTHTARRPTHVCQTPYLLGHALHLPYMQPVVSSHFILFAEHATEALFSPCLRCSEIFFYACFQCIIFTLYYFCSLMLLLQSPSCHTQYQILMPLQAQHPDTHVRQLQI